MLLEHLLARIPLGPKITFLGAKRTRANISKIYSDLEQERGLGRGRSSLQQEVSQFGSEKPEL